MKHFFETVFDSGFYFIAVVFIAFFSLVASLFVSSPVAVDILLAVFGLSSVAGLFPIISDK